MNKRIRKKIKKREQETPKTIKQVLKPIKEVLLKRIEADELIKGLEVRFNENPKDSYIVQRVAKDKTWADIATPTGNKRVKEPLTVLGK